MHFITLTRMHKYVKIIYILFFYSLGNTNVDIVTVGIIILSFLFEVYVQLFYNSRVAKYICASIFHMYVHKRIINTL